MTDLLGKLDLIPPQAPARPQERAHLSEEVAAYVRDLILSGHFHASEQLPIDRLAEGLDMSATPVREALLLLRGEGFVQFEPRRGFRVAPLAGRDIEDMFLVQAFVAGELAARAAKVAPPSLLSELRVVQDEMVQTNVESDPARFERLNFRFHQLINHSANSSKLAWLLGVCVRYAPRLFFSSIAGWHEASLRDHSLIIKALNQRDEEAARRAMAGHIEDAGRLLVSHLEQRGFWPEADDWKNA